MVAVVLVILGGEGIVFVVSVVWLELLVRLPCSWLLLEMGLGLVLAFELFRGGKGCLGFGGGRPAGDGMAAVALVSLVGVCGGRWLPAGTVATFALFCFWCVPGTISCTWQENHVSY